VHITSQLFEYKRLSVISAILELQFTTTVEKVALNSLKDIVPGLPLNFLILLKELLTSTVYMGAEVTACNRLYGDGAKVGAAAGVVH